MSPFEEGPPSAPICLLGEAPSTEEFKQGRPFVGPAGRVLDACLLASGLKRRDLRIINVFQEKVRKDEKGVAYGAAGALWKPNSGLTDAGREAFRPAEALLGECRANVYVPLGGVALSAVLPHTRGQIGKWRGSILEHEGRKFVSTYHPATVCWGSTHLQHVIATDLERVRAQSVSPTVSRRSRNLILNPTYRQCVDFLNMLRGEGRRFFFDLELFGGQLSAISLSNHPELSISIPFIAPDMGQRWSPPEEAALFQLLSGLLGDSAIPKGNQNVTFDAHILAKLYGIMVRGYLDDPMVLHSIALPDLEKGLDFQASWLTDVPYYKDDGGKRAWEDPWRNIEAFWRYSALDACVALECFEELEKQFGPSSPYWKTYRETMELVEPLVFMMLRGQRYDRKGMREARQGLLDEQDELKLELDHRHPGFNPQSSPQCLKLFYGTLGYAAMTIKGKPTTGEIALRRLERRGCWEARTILRLRAIKKQLDYFKELDTGQPRLYTAYNIRGTKTGRLSAAENEFEEGRNGQNLGSLIKTFLVTDEVEG